MQRQKSQISQSLNIIIWVSVNATTITHHQKMVPLVQNKNLRQRKKEKLIKLLTFPPQI